MTRKFTSGLTATALLVLTLVSAPAAHAQTPINLSNAAKDCDSNAVIYCGASTVNELQSKYNSNVSVQHIYAYFGISSADVKGMDAYAVAGTVTKSGDVLVGNTVVAKNALTGGREFISGSTKVTSNGVTFYTRKPAVSFRSNSLPAFVVMKNGVFQFALLAACGNPIKATPTTKPQTPPTTPTTPTTPTPTPTPVKTTTVSSVSTPTPAALPNTGPGEVVAIAAASSVLASAAYYFVAKRRLSL